jgi:hypothetical protein
MLEVLNNDAVRNSTFIATALVGLFAAYMYTAGSSNRGKGTPISDLPGPKRMFILGNVRNFPRKAWSATFASWREQMGESIGYLVND